MVIIPPELPKIVENTNDQTGVSAEETGEESAAANK
jgi:hypothetical protein